MKKFRNLSRSLSVLLLFAMLLPIISMTVSSADTHCAEAGCTGKYRNGICSADPGHYEAPSLEDGVYKIGNAGQLYWFAALVNSGDNEYDAGDNGDVYDAVLTADITVNGDLEWTPIGLYSGAREYIRYSGTFDGAGHTISGLYYSNTAYTGRVAGLFGCLDSNGTVKDLTLAESSINGAADIGGIVGHNYGTVVGCAQLGSVSGSGTTGGIVSRNMDGGRVEGCTNGGSVSGAVTGGIVGENDASVADCVNSGAITGTSSVGGVAGINSGSVTDSRNRANITGTSTHVGGVAGNHIGGEIAGCGSSGDVTGGSDYIGGVAGVCSGAQIRESWNSGHVNGSDKSDAVGGVVGAIDGTNLAKSTVTDCYNTGDVDGRSWVGGIAGVSGYQETPQTVELTNSYNTGTVTGTSHFGAVVGKLNKGTVRGTYYLADCAAAQNTISGAAEATAEQFASGEIAYALNGSREGVWHQNLDLENAAPDASPVLDPSHGVVHYGYKNCTDLGYTNGEAYEDPAQGHDWKGTTCQRCGAKRENPFTDVPEDSFYIDPVLWAVEEGITNGATATTFDPNGTCLRAHVVTFLWRAAGKPEPTTTENPFADVKETDFFYKAVLWAVEEGITNGVDANHFGPMLNCNRAQVVTFLWRCMGEPEPTATGHPFTDVAEDQFYFKPMLWAVEKGVTNGMTATTFGPTVLCNRAQVVTFLYRTMA